MRYLIIALLAILLAACTRQPGQAQADTTTQSSGPVRPGIQGLLAQPELLQGKRIALVANHTALVNGTHLADTLISLKHRVVNVFAPEHGFRGEAEAGETVTGGRDKRTGLPIISLYGEHYRPTRRQLQDVDIVVFDIQDVGCRFYTYLSTLVYVMDACAEYGKPLLVLDRPNPNGWYSSGPVLQPQLRSYVGVHAGVPVVHGLTLGEYARLVNGEGWLSHGRRCELKVLPCTGYTHRMRWADTGLPWVAPSPNLPNVRSAELYPILCWYEGTAVSVGRGTELPFQQLGAPWHSALLKRAMQDSLNGEQNPMEFYGLRGWATYFTPQSIPGKAVAPLYEGQRCYGLRMDSVRVGGDSLFLAGLHLLANFYHEHTQEAKGGAFFNDFFDKLAGTPALRRGIIAGVEPQQLLSGWLPALQKWRALRQRYLLYPER